MDNTRTKIQAYMVMVSTSIQELLELFNNLVQGAEENNLQINTGKTEMMHFRKERKMRHEDRIASGWKQLKVVKYYKYLGITLHSSGTAFTMYIRRKH
jgi:hypothetical protein